MNPQNQFTTDLKLPYSAVNANGKIKADWLLNIFQDAASHQCDAFGISGFDMAKKKLKWVVAQYNIHIHDHVDWLSPMRLTTSRAPWKNLYEVRQFSLTSEDGTCLVEACGIWILIRAETGRPVRLAPHMPGELMQVSASEPELFKPPGEFGEFHHETGRQARFLDLDLNQHVNNRVYLRWAVESLPEPYCFDYTPVQCRVAYLKEGLYSHRILSRIKLEFTQAGLTTGHSIFNETTETELARLLIKWEKIPQRFSANGS
ncbi:MAG: thioesterase [Desulfobacterales bacterium]|nr:thioesterase [Desulfobacterales bacterium]